MMQLFKVMCPSFQNHKSLQSYIQCIYIEKYAIIFLFALKVCSIYTSETGRPCSKLSFGDKVCSIYTSETGRPCSKLSFGDKVCPIYTSETGRPCSKLSFGDGNIVCRCNATYCDTVEPVEPLTPGTFVRYTSSREGRRLDRSLGRFSQAPDGGKLQKGIGGTLKTLTTVKKGII